MTGQATAIAALIAVMLAHAAPVLAGDIPAPERKSGYAFMSRETQAMQDDDTANPGMLWVLDGEALWNRTEGEAGRSCAACHGKAGETMKGVAARYPAIDPASARPLDLEQRINICRSQHQKAPPLSFESREMLALSAYLGHLSKGAAITVAENPQTRPFIDAGRRLFEMRQGQLNLSCAQCHDDNWGERLGGAPIPQGHPTGYPIYRLEWQSLGSLRRRLRGCLAGMRAASYPDDAADIVNLEFYLAWRARGMPLETPAVRP